VVPDFLPDDLEVFVSEVLASLVEPPALALVVVDLDSEPAPKAVLLLPFDEAEVIPEDVDPLVLPEPDEDPVDPIAPDDVLPPDDVPEELRDVSREPENNPDELSFDESEEDMPLLDEPPDDVLEVGFDPSFFSFSFIVLISLVI
jgi:hypothetical protein